jgi:BTB/POZ domain
LSRQARAEVANLAALTGATPVSPPRGVFAGGDTTIVVLTDGSVVESGQWAREGRHLMVPPRSATGDGARTFKFSVFAQDAEHHRIVYASPGYEHVILVSDRGNLLVYGTARHGTIPEPLSGSEPKLLTDNTAKILASKFVVQVDSGHYHVIARTLPTPPVVVSDSSLEHDMRAILALDDRDSVTVVTVAQPVFEPCLAALCGGSADNWSGGDSETFRFLVLLCCCGKLLAKEEWREPMRRVADALHPPLTPRLHFGPNGSPVTLDDSASQLRRYWGFPEGAISGTSFRVEDFPASKFADVRLEVDGRVLLGHRCILERRCQRFRAEFEWPGTGERQEGVLVHTVHEVDLEPFSELLRFLYLDEVELTGENVLGVLAASTVYLLPRLTELCEKFLVQALDVDNVIDLWIFAETHVECVQLWKGAEHFVRTQAEDIRVAVAADEALQATWRELLAFPSLVAAVEAMGVTVAT